MSRGGAPRRAARLQASQPDISKQTPTPGRHTTARLMSRAARAARSCASTLPTGRPTHGGPLYNSTAASPSGPLRNLWRPGRGAAAAAAAAEAAAAAADCRRVLRSRRVPRGVCPGTAAVQGRVSRPRVVFSRCQVAPRRACPPLPRGWVEPPPPHPAVGGRLFRGRLTSRAATLVISGKFLQVCPLGLRGASLGSSGCTRPWKRVVLQKWP